MNTPAGALNTLSRTRWALLLFAVLATLAILGQTLWAIAQDKQQTLNSETTNGLVAVRLLEEHASQTLQDAVHTLDRVARAIQLSPHADDPTAIRNLVATHDISHSRHLKALQYVTPEGISWISSPDYPTHQSNASYRNHIQYLLHHPTFHGALVGRPYASAYDSQWVIPVARTLYNLNDQPVGVISVDIRLSYFGALYSRVAKENNASVTLVSDEGFILARSPFEARYVDRDVPDSVQKDYLRRPAAEGSFSDDTFLDDDEGTKLYTYRKLAGFPITTVYAREVVSILASWERRTLERILLATLTIVLIAALSHFLLSYIRRLQKTQISLRESESKFMGLFMQSPTPSFLVNFRDGRFVEVNDAWLTLFEFERSEVPGRTGLELGIWIDASEREKLMQTLLRGDTLVREEVQLRSKSGNAMACIMSGRTFEAGSDRLIIFSLIDVTRQRAVEQEIRDMNLQLERRVQARTEKLEIANRDLSAALASVHAMQNELVRSEKMAALGSLVAGVAHELNTPIGNSVTVGSAMQEYVRDLSSTMEKGELRRSTLQAFIEQTTRGTEILMRSLTRASQLIRSFKRVAVDQSSDQRRRFDLQTTLREVCLTLEPMYKNKPYQLTLDLPDEASMDGYPGALGQLITNFVSNALQHGFEGRDHGTMHLQATVRPGGHVALHFSDDGVGMNEETRRRVFDPFFTTKLGQGGSGLGMNIAYNIVHEVLGGSIEITSSPGAGTHIMVDLPLTAPQAPHIADERSDSIHAAS
ncbi:MAG: PAS domain S-box protein [Burkholderiales bacterium]|nr:PAS domain S-box protein [Burkholderiales bacterium]